MSSGGAFFLAWLMSVGLFAALASSTKNERALAQSDPVRLAPCATPSMEYPQCQVDPPSSARARVNQCRTRATHRPPCSDGDSARDEIGTAIARGLAEGGAHVVGEIVFETIFRHR